MKNDNFKNGYTLVEAVVAIGIMAIFIFIFIGSFYYISYSRYIKNKSLAFNLAHEEIEALRELPFEKLTNRTEAHFINVAYNLGQLSVETSNQAISPPNIYNLARPKEITSGVSGLAILPGGDFEDFTFETQLKALSDSDNSWQLGVVFRYQDVSNFYRLRLASNDLIFYKVVDGGNTILYSKSQVFSKDVWYKLKIEASGSNFNIYLDDNLLTATPVSDEAFSKGKLGLIGSNSVHAHFDEAKVTTGQTTTWHFDGSEEKIGETASGWQRFGINDLPSAIDKLTIEDAINGYDDLKKITAKVEWQEQGNVKSVFLVTYLHE